MNWGVNMNKIYIGKVVNTHGIKGEIRILSNFEYKDKVFKVNNKLIIGDKTYEIKSHRIHKGYNMFLFLFFLHWKEQPFSHNRYGLSL